MKLFINKEDCCGCSACMSICPKKAINMEKDEKGFIYPQIDEKKCVDCGLCKKACGFINDYDKSELLNESIVYAARYNDDNARKKSSSGGIFYALSEYVLENGGVVYGAVFDDEFNVKHIRAITREDRDKQLGAKYVQSSIGSSYRDARKDLEEGRLVLFTGTPCQIASLQTFLNKHYDNLIKCDIICHSVPSPKVFKEYIKELENRYDSKVKRYSFRGKGQRVISQAVKVDFEDGKKYSKGDIAYDPFGALFGSDKISRPSCFKCKFTNMERPSDITIGDFWGIQKAVPGFADKNGTSVIIVNTDKGIDTINKINMNLTMVKSSFDKCPHKNLRKNSKKPIDYDKAWEDYKNNGYLYLAKKYGRDNVKDQILIRIKSIVKRIKKQVMYKC